MPLVPKCSSTRCIMRRMVLSMSRISIAIISSAQDTKSSRHTWDSYGARQAALDALPTFREDFIPDKAPMKIEVGTFVGVEKLKISEIRTNLGDRKCPGDQRES